MAINQTFGSELDLIQQMYAQIVLCLYSFDAQNPQELSFSKHERLDILEHPADVRGIYGQMTEI